MEEDFSKIRDIVDKLNTDAGLDIDKDELEWEPIDGIRNLQAIRINREGEVVKRNSHTPVKAFINRRTGELRLYAYLMVTKDHI